MEVSVPTRFMRDWIQNHYAEKILAMCAEATSESEEPVKRLQIVVVQNAIIDDEAEDEAPSKKANQNKKIDVSEISSPLDERFTFDTFVVGKPNALAHAAARRVVESMSIPFNPLLYLRRCWFG